MFSRIVLGLLAFLITLPAGAEQIKTIPETQNQISLSYAPLVKKVSPAVVNIYTQRTVKTGFRSPFMGDPFFERFFGGADPFFGGGGMRERVESSLGSGVIVAQNGLVITNAHVIEGAQEITVVLKEGGEYEAKVILADEASDLALLAIEDEEQNFPFVTLKPSESLEVGDLVLAIGNPFGVGQTVTSGIVSAQGRSSLDISDYNFFIQTDAAINPGNSGGALVAMDGGVVGINTAIFSRSGGSMGLGFAIPSEMVVSVLAAAQSGQTGANGIIRPWLGVTAQDVTSDIAASIGLKPPHGAMVSRLHPASPLVTAGVKTGDVITAMKGAPLKTAAEMKFKMATIPIGNDIAATVFREGKEFEITIKSIAPPDNPPRNETKLTGKHLLNGVTIANLNPAVTVELGISGEEEGVIITDVPRGSYAARVVRPADIIIEINSQKITSPAEVEPALAAKPSSQGTSIILNRGGRINKIFVR